MKGIKGFQKGYTPWNKGLKYTHPAMFKKGDAPWNKGKTTPIEVRKKLSDAHKGMKKPWAGGNMAGLKHSDETRLKMSIAQKGKTHSEETRKKMRLNNIREKCNFWKGGISDTPYPSDWCGVLKKSIRKRDNYVCQICNKNPSVFVHHIDYDKQNCKSDNLVTLCRGCHSKTNSNREHWIAYFTERMNDQPVRTI